MICFRLFNLRSERKTISLQDLVIAKIFCSVIKFFVAIFKERTFWVQKFKSMILFTPEGLDLGFHAGALLTDTVSEEVLIREGGQHNVVRGHVRGEHDVDRDGVGLRNLWHLASPSFFLKPRSSRDTLSERVMISHPGYLSKRAFLKTKTKNI